MKAGVVILSVFAAVWAIAGLISIDADWWLWLLPIVISAALASWCWRIVIPAEDPAEGKRIGRLVGFWSAIQGVAIFVAANVVTWLGQPTMIGPAICCIVGLHFLPLARGMPRPLYYGTGAVMVLAGVVAIALPIAWRLPTVGLIGSVTLWLTSVAIISRAQATSSCAPSSAMPRIYSSP